MLISPSIALPDSALNQLAIILVVQSGWLHGNQKRVLLFAAGVNAVSLGVGLSPVGRWLSLLPLPALVAFQGFRLPLELVLHSWVAQGVIPFTMTWSGQNWDIIRACWR